MRVVGTNGKGSVTNMVAAGLRAEGKVTGRFLSPHVESFLERVGVNDETVQPSHVSAFVSLARSALATKELPPDLRPAFFELTLALALHEFAASGVTHAVLEAGVGGRSDATTAAVSATKSSGSRGATNLRLVVLTNVDLDHTETLGTDVGAIAAEKAGVFVAGVPAVTGATGEALETVTRVAARTGAPLYVDDGTDSLFSLPLGAPPELSSSQGFATRRANARLASASLRLLGAKEDSLVAALNAPSLPARGERLEVDRRQVVLDGAHDPAAAAKLRADVKRRYVLLFGSLARKQGAATLAALEPAATAVVVTAVEPDDDIARFGSGGRELIADPAAALRRALELTQPGGLLLIAGSLYLAGTLRPLLHSRTA